MYTDVLLEYLEKHGKIAGKLPSFRAAQIFQFSPIAQAQLNQCLASGACGCVGMMGAGLGGGHGRLQGLYGLILDNMIDANIVLADGSQILVSEESHPDLWWGLRGAGQNFGIVTRFTYKIYDIPKPEHYFAQLIFTQDKLEQIFTEINILTEETLPKEIGAILVNYAWVLPVSTAEVCGTIDAWLAGRYLTYLPTAGRYSHCRLLWQSNPGGPIHSTILCPRTSNIPRGQRSIL